MYYTKNQVLYNNYFIITNAKITAAAPIIKKVFLLVSLLPLPLTSLPKVVELVGSTSPLIIAPEETMGVYSPPPLSLLPVPEGNSLEIVEPPAGAVSVEATVVVVDVGVVVATAAVVVVVAAAAVVVDDDGIDDTVDAVPDDTEFRGAVVVVDDDDGVVVVVEEELPGAPESDDVIPEIIDPAAVDDDDDDGVVVLVVVLVVVVVVVDDDEPEEELPGAPESDDVIPEIIDPAVGIILVFYTLNKYIITLLTEKNDSTYNYRRNN